MNEREKITFNSFPLLTYFEMANFNSFFVLFKVLIAQSCLIYIQSFCLLFEWQGC